MHLATYWLAWDRRDGKMVLRGGSRTVLPRER